MASEPMTTPEPSTLEPFTADELDEMTARLGLGFTIETWNGPFPFGDKERHSVVFMTDDELRRLIAQARAARPSPWLPMETAPTDGTVFLAFAPAAYGLSALYALCAWHPDAGFFVDELREATHWQPLPARPAQDGGRP